MKWACDFYNRHFLVIELALAGIVAAGFYLCIQVFWSSDDLVLFLSGSRQSVYTGIASLTGSLLGFVIAAVPIVLGFSQTPRLKVVRESQHYSEVFRIFFQAIYWLSFAAIWALVAIFLDTDKRPRTFVVYLMVFLFAAVVVRVFRCVWVLKKITAIATQIPAA